MKKLTIIITLIILLFVPSTVYAEETNPGVYEVPGLPVYEDGYVYLCFKYTNNNPINFGIIYISDYNPNGNIIYNTQSLVLLGENCKLLQLNIQHYTLFQKEGCGETNFMYIKLEPNSSYEVYFTPCRVFTPLVGF